MRIKVIIPSYNCKEWIGRALESVAIQDYVNYDVLVIDDASTEHEQPKIIAEFCEKNGWDYILNDVNMRAGYNLFKGIHAMSPESDDVIFILDGDDFLPHEKVFSRIAEVYQDDDVWFCYGQYEPYPRNTGQIPSKPYPQEYLDDADSGRLRREMNLVNHPITFRYFLFCGLSESDMQDDRGNWFRAGYDRLMFIPMLEMCRNHYRFIDEVLYMYNAVNPISDSSANLEDARAAHRAVAVRRPKKMLVRN